MPRLTLVLLLCLAAPPALPEVLDRIAAVVGRSVITLSDVFQEIRLSAFQNQTKADFGAASRRSAAERLIERALIRTETEIGHYLAVEDKEAAAALEAFRKERFRDTDSFRAALAAYGLREEDLEKRIREQLATLRFIEARFSPAVQLTEAEIQQEYAGRFVPEWLAKMGGQAPPLESVRGEIEAALRGRRVDQLLDAWLREARSRTDIEIKEEAFQ